VWFVKRGLKVTFVHNVCHAGSVSHNAGNAMVWIPGDTRALLELPEASGEAMTNGIEGEGRPVKNK
jgi:hypothetical protein